MILKSKQINLGKTSLGKQRGKRSILRDGAENRANGGQGHTCVGALINQVLKELDSPNLGFFSHAVWGSLWGSGFLVQNGLGFLQRLLDSTNTQF